VKSMEAMDVGKIITFTAMLGVTLFLCLCTSTAKLAWTSTPLYRFGYGGQTGLICG